jgi:hydrogenase/urease accessory protein HupE
MKTTPALAALTLTALAPGAAAAHEGHHDGMTAGQGLHHLLTQPDHLAMLALFAVLAGWGGWRAWRARAPR